VAQVAKCLPTKHEAFSSNRSTAKKQKSLPGILFSKTKSEAMIMPISLPDKRTEIAYYLNKK
jgi:hypothetical protein